jgi:hypothetical protein
MLETNIVVIHDQIPQILIPRFSQLAPRTREHRNIARVAHIEELYREEEARKTRQVKVKNVTCEFFFPTLSNWRQRKENALTTNNDENDGQTRARERAPIETNTNFKRHQRWEFETFV